MFDNEFLQKLSSRAAALFPAAESARHKLEQDLHGLLKTSLAKVNVVTREEFDAQLQALERAQAHINRLEIQLIELEAKLAAKPAGDGAGEQQA